jgi:RHS repeat-associated protein
LGNIATVTKHSGQSAHDYFYDPYGNIIDNNGRPEDSSNWTDPHNHYLLNGKEWDEEMRLHYFGARYYDSAAGVWLTQDIYRGEPRQPMTLHRTLYVLANPINRVDAYGYMAEIYANGFGGAGGGSEPVRTTNPTVPNATNPQNAPYHYEWTGREDLYFNDHSVDSYVTRAAPADTFADSPWYCTDSSFCLMDTSASSPDPRQELEQQLRYLSLSEEDRELLQFLQSGNLWANNLVMDPDAAIALGQSLNTWGNNIIAWPATIASRATILTPSSTTLAYGVGPLNEIKLLPKGALLDTPTGIARFSTALSYGLPVVTGALSAMDIQNRETSGDITAEQAGQQHLTNVGFTIGASATGGALIPAASGATAKIVGFSPVGWAVVGALALGYDLAVLQGTVNNLIEGQQLEEAFINARATTHETLTFGTWSSEQIDDFVGSNVANTAIWLIKTLRGTNDNR